MFEENNHNLNETEPTTPTENSYTAMRSETPQIPSTSSYYNVPVEEEPKPKKKRMAPRILAVVVAMALVSAGSIRGYQYIQDHDSLSAFFGLKDSESSVLSETGKNTAEATKNNEDKDSSSDTNKAVSQNWIDLAAPSGSLSLPEIVDKVMPSVVGVSSTFSWEESYSGWFGPSESQKQSATATGTGIIMTADGYVITNAHVIYDADHGGKATDINVVLNDDVGYDQTEYAATLIGYDVEADLAVLKVDAKDLVAAEFGDSDALSVGELVVAIGNPLGFELFGSVTCGIVSALNREVTISENTMSLIQTDAAINSGNSGGPLINAYGQVVGINSAKISSSYSSTTIEGLGFAIPVGEAKSILNDLINFGYVTGKPQIGIGAADVSETQSRMYNMPVGVYVSEVYENGAAAEAGVQKGDVIIAINGETIKTYNELNAIKNKFSAGDQIKLTVTRNDQDLELTLTLKEKTPDMQ